MKKNIYLILAILGFVAPYYFFLQLSGENGFDMAQIVQQVSASSILSGIAMDLLVSVLVFWVYMFAESNKLQMKNPWIYLLATLLVGLSFSLPLFLYFRERKITS